MNFAENFSELLVSFNKEGVEYMVVGGYAVNFHGYERTTSDLDVWVKSSSENQKKIYHALIKMGYAKNDVQHILNFDISQRFLFHIEDKPNDVEVFNFISGVKYEEAEPRKILFNYANKLPVYFIGVRDGCK